MDERGIKYENAQKGWRCTTLNDAVFPTADEAVEALDATQAIMNLFTSSRAHDMLEKQSVISYCP